MRKDVRAEEERRETMIDEVLKQRGKYEGEKEGRGGRATMK